VLNNEDSRAVLPNLSALRSIGIDDPSKAINKRIKITVPLERFGAKLDEVSDDFLIVGVVDSGSGSELFMPSNVFDIAGVPNYSNLKVVADDIINVTSVRSQIESIGFQTSSLADTIIEIDNIFKFLNFILIGFGGIGMIVAILGMFNTLTISLLERTKEIGLMMALGARRSDMRRLFMYDAVIISFAGALSGIFIAVITGRIVNWVVNIGAASRGVSEPFEMFAAPAWMTCAVILVTVLVGLVVVYYPSRRAEKINPIDALRRE
jgi:ABC-type antimicrobial peptide transport system permease subunit